MRRAPEHVCPDTTLRSRGGSAARGVARPLRSVPRPSRPRLRPGASRRGVAGASRVPCRVVRKKGAHRSARRGVLQHARSGFFGRPGSPLRPRLAPKASRERQAPPFSPFATPRPARGRRERRGRPVVVPTVRTGASRRRRARPSAGAAPCPTLKTPLERAPRWAGMRSMIRAVFRGGITSFRVVRGSAFGRAPHHEERGAPCRPVRAAPWNGAGETRDLQRCRDRMRSRVSSAPLRAALRPGRQRCVVRGSAFRGAPHHEGARLGLWPCTLGSSPRAGSRHDGRWRLLRRVGGSACPLHRALRGPPPPLRGGG
jgi:hypothetical protein